MDRPERMTFLEIRRSTTDPWTPLPLEASVARAKRLGVAGQLQVVLRSETGSETIRFQIHPLEVGPGWPD